MRRTNHGCELFLLSAIPPPNLVEGRAERGAPNLAIELALALALELAVKLALK